MKRGLKALGALHYPEKPCYKLGGSVSSRSVFSFSGPKLLDPSADQAHALAHTNGHGRGDIHPKTKARTRFAPSPTGSIHLGSLRTALYNYLLAKNTGGQFLLRLEDTDQKRLVPGAEENIYRSLEWAGLTWDEGPLVGGPYGPYRQSERSDIYNQYSQKLLDNGHAYRCFCSRDRLDGLTESAKKLYPPSLASYDRKCAHMPLEQSNEKAYQGHSHTIRLKSPAVYPQFQDLLHGNSNLQVQINHSDVRYDDPVLVKSDGLPTYHLANVVDDHLMKITHVIRGEEWLPSTPKHLTLYDSFGWTPPQFVHIPLLTSATDKKLSKRSGDASILFMATNEHILPEALINFVALFGWSPSRHDSIGKTVSEIFTLDDLVKQFSLNGLTKGNARVDFKKLYFFNQHFFRQKLQDDQLFRQKVLDQLLTKELAPFWQLPSDIPDTKRKSTTYTDQLLHLFGPSISSTADFVNKARYFYVEPELPDTTNANFKAGILQEAINKWPFEEKSQKQNKKSVNLETATEFCQKLTESATKKEVFSTLRFSLLGNKPGLTVPQIMTQLGGETCLTRLQNALCKYQ